MSVAAQTLTEAGLEEVGRRESALTAYALDRLRSVPGLKIYGDTDPRQDDDRVGVISFNIGSVHHALVAAVLGYEGGIGVRSGCFCAQPYVSHLLALSETEQMEWQRALRSGDQSRKPGMVRISFGAYNTFEDVDALVEMLVRIARQEYQGKYHPVAATGEYLPAGHRDSLEEYFSLTSVASQRRLSMSRAWAQVGV